MFRSVVMSDDTICDFKYDFDGISLVLSAVCLAHQTEWVEKNSLLILIEFINCRIIGETRIEKSMTK